jgi:hypothetical protein
MPLLCTENFFLFSKYLDEQHHFFKVPVQETILTIHYNCITDSGSMVISTLFLPFLNINPAP